MTPQQQREMNALAYRKPAIPDQSQWRNGTVGNRGPRNDAPRFPTVDNSPIPDDPDAILKKLKELPRQPAVDMSMGWSAAKQHSADIGARQKQLIDKANSLGMDITYGGKSGWSAKPIPPKVEKWDGGGSGPNIRVPDDVMDAANAADPNYVKQSVRRENAVSEALKELNEPPKQDTKRRTGLLMPTEEERNSIPARLPSDLNPNGIPSVAWNAPQSGGDNPAGTPPKSNSGFPAAWGPPPRMETRDMVPLPMGGMGSSTMRNWQNEKMKQFGTPPNTPSQTNPGEGKPQIGNMGPRDWWNKTPEQIAAGGSPPVKPSPRPQPPAEGKPPAQGGGRPPVMPSPDGRHLGPDGWLTPRQPAKPNDRIDIVPVTSKSMWDELGMTEREWKTWKDAGEPKGNAASRDKQVDLKLKQDLKDAKSKGDTARASEIQDKISLSNATREGIKAGMSRAEAEKYADREVVISKQKPAANAGLKEGPKDREWTFRNQNERETWLAQGGADAKADFTGVNPYKRLTPQEYDKLESAKLAGDPKAREEYKNRFEQGQRYLGSDAVRWLHDPEYRKEKAWEEKIQRDIRGPQADKQTQKWYFNNMSGAEREKLAGSDPQLYDSLKRAASPSNENAQARAFNNMSESERTRLANSDPNTYDSMKKAASGVKANDKVLKQREAASDKTRAEPKTRETTQRTQPQRNSNIDSDVRMAMNPNADVAKQARERLTTKAALGDPQASNALKVLSGSEKTGQLPYQQRLSDKTLTSRGGGTPSNDLQRQTQANRDKAVQKLGFKNAAEAEKAGVKFNDPGQGKGGGGGGGKGGGGGRPPAAPKLTAKERNAQASAKAAKEARRVDSKGYSDAQYVSEERRSAEAGEKGAQRDARFRKAGLNPNYDGHFDNDDNVSAIQKSREFGAKNLEAKEKANQQKAAQDDARQKSLQAAKDKMKSANAGNATAQAAKANGFSNVKDYQTWLNIKANQEQNDKANQKKNSNNPYGFKPWDQVLEDNNSNTGNTGNTGSNGGSGGGGFSSGGGMTGGGSSGNSGSGGGGGSQMSGALIGYLKRKKEGLV